MLSRFQILVIEYTEHDEVTRMLLELAESVKHPFRAPVSWSWGRVEVSTQKSVPEFEVVRGPLPETRADGDCLAVSAGGRPDSGFFFSTAIENLLEKCGVAKSQQRRPLPLSQYLGIYPDHHVYAVRARSENDKRRLSDIYNASLELFKHAAPRYRCIRMQLLAAGGTDNRQAEPRAWKVRPFPERFSFTQIVRAWGKWRRDAPPSSAMLTLHVSSESVYTDIASGRIDVAELLSCSDIRFWLEVVSSTGEIERRLFQEMPDVTLGRIVEAVNLSADYWSVEVSPAPSVDELAVRPVRDRLKCTLEDLGVVPGSTLHFRRIDAGQIESGGLEVTHDPKLRQKKRPLGAHRSI